MTPDVTPPGLMWFTVREATAVVADDGRTIGLLRPGHSYRGEPARPGWVELTAPDGRRGYCPAVRVFPVELPEPGPQRPPWPAAVAILLVLAIAAGGLALLATRDDTGTGDTAAPQGGLVRVGAVDLPVPHPGPQLLLAAGGVELVVLSSHPAEPQLFVLHDLAITRSTELDPAGGVYWSLAADASGVALATRNGVLLANLDLRDERAVDTPGVGEPKSLAISGGEVYLALEDSDQVATIDRATAQVTEVRPSGGRGPVGVEVDGDTLYLTHHGAADLTAIARTGAPQPVTVTAGPEPRPVVFYDEGWFVAANREARTLTRAQVGTGYLTTRDLPGRPCAVAVVGERVVINVDGESVVLVDLYSPTTLDVVSDPDLAGCGEGALVQPAAVIGDTVYFAGDGRVVAYRVTP